MRKLFIMQGAPATGKSRMLKMLGAYYNDLVVSRDELRDMFSPGVHALDGEVRYATNAVERMITSAFDDIVENRLRMGSTVFLDGTYPNKKSQGAVVEMAKKHGYDCYLVNMQKVTSLEDAIVYDSGRNAKQRVGENVISMFYERVNSSPNHPDLIEVDMGENFQTAFVNIKKLFRETVEKRKLDVARYDNVVVLGDVHSCSDKLERALIDNGGLDNKSNLYIFVGDLFDRGFDPVGVYDAVSKNRDNVVLLEGNHEKNLREIVNSVNLLPYRSTQETVDKLKAAGVSNRELKAFSRRLLPWVSFVAGGKHFFVSHGGVTQDVITSHLLSADGTGMCVSDREFIYGTSHRGKAYRGFTTYDNVDEFFSGDGLSELTPIQIHGHRNTARGEERVAIDATPGVYNLEQGVEDDGYLAVAVVDVATGAVTCHNY